MDSKRNKTPTKNEVKTKYRRSSGEGSIFLRKDGRWSGAITIGHDENGKIIKKTVYGRNQTEVAKKLSEISGRIKNNSYEIIEHKIFGELMFEWLLVFKKSSVTPRTFEGIIRNFKLHIEPIIGNMKVYQIDTFVVQQVINKLIDAEYSLNVIKKNKHLIGQFFEYAIDNKWVQENPTRKVVVKARDRKIYSGQDRYKALTPEARKEFLTALNHDEANFLKPLCYVLLFAGLRIGEAIALQWKNYLDSGLTKPVTTSTKVTTAKDHTLYSKWVVNQYRTDANTFVNETKYTNDNSFLKYDVKVDGVVAYTNIGDYCKDVNYGSVVEFYNFKVQAGYKFTSYYSTPTNILNSGSSLTSVKITVGANDNNYINFVLSSNIYALTLDRQSGSGGTASIYMKYAVGFYSNSGASTSITGITKPTRAGFTFQGYYTDTSGKGTQIIDKSGKIVGANNYIAANDTLYANWTANNPAYYDEEGVYYYVEIGNMPQTLVKDTTTINALNKASNNSKTYSIAGQTLVTRSYNNDEYCLYNNNWYKVEPIRWRLAYSSSQKSGYGTTTDTFAVLDTIVYAGVYSANEIGLNSGYVTTTLDEFKKNITSTTYLATFSANVESYTGTGITSSSQSANMFIASAGEISNVLNNKTGSAKYSVKFSDLVSDILGNGIKQYYTRNLGSNTSTIKSYTELGMPTQNLCTNLQGVQFTIKVSEYGCV